MEVGMSVAGTSFNSLWLLPFGSDENSFSAEAAEWKAWEDNVIIHENLHASVGGAFAGSPEYDYEVKPDGKAYIVSGRVMIDTSFDEAKPEDMVKKFDIVERAALAPSDPSAADLAIAGEARSKASKASGLLSEKQEKEKNGIKNSPVSAIDGLPIFNT
jgi:hypothetical protein